MRLRLSRPAGPARLLFGPVFQKEVRTSGRRRSTYFARMFTALGLLGTVGLAFLAWAVDNYQSDLGRMQELQTLAPVLAIIVVWFQFIVLGFIAPQLTSGGICDERRAQTLSSLLTTPLRPSEIVFGKLSSRLVQILILSLLAVPMLLAIRIFGGLAASFVLGATAVALSTAVLGASLGLMLSLWARRASSAAGSALLLLILVQAGPTVIELLRVYAVQRYLGTSAWFYDNIYATSSPVVMFNLSLSTAMGTEPMSVLLTFGQQTYNVGPAWVFNAGYNLLAAAFAASFTSIMLRRTMLRMAADAPQAPRLSRRARRRRTTTPPPHPSPGDGSNEPAATPEAVAGAAPPAHRPSRTVRGNPVLWRELRQQAYGSRKRLLLMALAAGLGLGLLYWRVGLDEEGVHILIAVFGSLLVLGQSVALTTNPISSEREATTWEALIATPLTGRQVIGAKFLGSLRAQWFFFSIITAHFIIAAAAAVYWPPAVVLGALVLLGPIAFFTATAQFLSLVFRRATTATLINFGLMLALYLGPWIFAALVQGLTDGSVNLFETNYLAAAFAFNPVAMLATMAERAADTIGSGPRRSFYIGEAQVTRSQYVGIIIVIFTMYVLASLAVLSIAARLFNRCSGRAS